jgi:putative ABC transport system ATP-binding protein
MNRPALESAVIEARGVTKTFGTGALAVAALKGVDLTVQRGEFLMLVGPSGSGKTTLLSMLGCVLAPTTGDLALFGEVVSKRPEAEMPRLRLSYIGFVFQAHNLIASLTALDNVAFQLELRGQTRRAALLEARALLERVGLGAKTNSHPRELSGGERQRVAIARAIAGAPPLILADEPTASLDAETGLMITEMMRELARERGHTVIVVTHDSRIFRLADRIVHIEDGLITQERIAS